MTYLKAAAAAEALNDLDFNERDGRPQAILEAHPEKTDLDIGGFSDIYIFPDGSILAREADFGNWEAYPGLADLYKAYGVTPHTSARTEANRKGWRRAHRLENQPKLLNHQGLKAYTFESLRAFEGARFIRTICANNELEAAEKLRKI